MYKKQREESGWKAMQDDMMAMRKDNPLRRNDYWSPIGDTKVMATKNALRLVLINYLYVMGLYHGCNIHFKQSITFIKQDDGCEK